MRSFLTALLILTGILVLIFLNAAAVRQCTDELLLLCRETAEGSAPDAADLLLSRWERCRDFISISSNYRDIQDAETALIGAMSAMDPVSRDANLNLFAAALRRIADGQRFDLFNIL